MCVCERERSEIQSDESNCFILPTMIYTYTKASLVAQTLKESAKNAGDLGFIPGLERSSEEWNGNPLQYSWLENPMDRGAWRATVHGATKGRTWLSMHAPVLQGTVKGGLIYTEGHIADSSEPSWHFVCTKALWSSYFFPILLIRKLIGSDGLCWAGRQNQAKPA